MDEFPGGAQSFFVCNFFQPTFSQILPQTKSWGVKSKIQEVLFQDRLIKATRSPEFIATFKRVKEGFHANPKMADATFRKEYSEDINTLVNAYDNIAVLCLNKFADICIIKTSIEHALKDLFPIIDKNNS